MSDTQKILFRLYDEFLKKAKVFSRVIFDYNELREHEEETIRHLKEDRLIGEGFDEGKFEFDLETFKISMSPISNACIIGIALELMRLAKDISLFEVPCENLWDIWEKDYVWKEFFADIEIGSDFEAKFFVELGTQVFKETGIFAKPVVLRRDSEKYEFHRNKEGVFSVKHLI